MYLWIDESQSKGIVAGGSYSKSHWGQNQSWMVHNEDQRNWLR